MELQLAWGWAGISCRFERCRSTTGSGAGIGVSTIVAEPAGWDRRHIVSPEVALALSFGLWRAKPTVPTSLFPSINYII